MKTMRDELQDAQEEIARLEKMLLSTHSHLFFRCPECERVYHIIDSANEYKVGALCCNAPRCIERTKYAEKLKREAAVGDDYLYDTQKETPTYGKRPKEEIRFLERLDNTKPEHRR